VEENSPGLMKVRKKIKLAVSSLYVDDLTQVLYQTLLTQNIFIFRLMLFLLTAPVSSGIFQGKDIPVIFE